MYKFQIKPSSFLQKTGNEKLKKLVKRGWFLMKLSDFLIKSSDFLFSWFLHHFTLWQILYDALFQVLNSVWPKILKWTLDFRFFFKNLKISNLTGWFLDQFLWFSWKSASFQAVFQSMSLIGIDSPMNIYNADFVVLPDWGASKTNTINTKYMYPAITPWLSNQHKRIKHN
jgi:hypothetical protein